MLGPLEVRTDADPGEIVEVPGARLRALLIMLALHPGQPVPAVLTGIEATPLAAHEAQIRRGQRAAGPGVPAAPRPA